MIKCPKCELNYMPDDAGCCVVCMKMLHGTDAEELDICPECGKAFTTGKELCNSCLRKQTEEESENEEEQDYVEEENFEDLGLTIIEE